MERNSLSNPLEPVPRELLIFVFILVLSSSRGIIFILITLIIKKHFLCELQNFVTAITDLINKFYSQILCIVMENVVVNI